MVLLELQVNGLDFQMKKKTNNNFMCEKKIFSNA